jgi:hypothetical protein
MPLSYRLRDDLRLGIFLGFIPGQREGAPVLRTSFLLGFL